MAPRSLFLLAGLLFAASLQATELRPNVLDPNYQHDRFETQPQDHVREFRAYTTSFDGDDDDDGDGDSDVWGIPEWVAYEIKEAPNGVPPAFEERPRPWMHDDELVEAGVCPTDDSYLNSGYDRGHMCMREISRRLGRDADWNTHTTVNACPQEHDMNAGVWLGLEIRTADWADTYGSVWVICGPVINGFTPSDFIGDPGELPVAIPDAFFKVVVKEDGSGGFDVLSFLIPQQGTGNFNSPNHPLGPYLTSVDTIEALTGLDLLTALDDDQEEALEEVVPTALWPIGAGPFAGPAFAPAFAPERASPLELPPIPEFDTSEDRKYVPSAIPGRAPFAAASSAAFAPAEALPPSANAASAASSAPAAVAAPAPCCQPCPPPRPHRLFWFRRR